MRRNIIVEVLRDDSGTSAMEYGILVCCVSTAAILSLTSLGEAAVALFDRVTNELAALALTQVW
jgi:Flp pilus assembly pilin Flp